MAISLRMPSKLGLRKLGYRQGRPRKLYREDEFETEEFVFGDEDPADDEIEDISLHKLSHNRSRLDRYTENLSAKPKTTVQYKIKSRDTLQSVSLKYGCTISELKRHNNLISDQDFYALSVLKIPVKEHSFLSEVLSHTSPNGSEDEQSKLFHVSIGRMLDDGDLPEAKSFLDEMDRDIQRIVSQVQSKKPSDSEEQDALSKRHFEPLVIEQKDQSLDGANWGISWCSLILVILILGILAPTFYGIYIVVWTTHQNTTTSSLVKSDFANV